MFVPAHNQKLLDSAVRRDADVLLLDIEDSVPICRKQLPVTILRILLTSGFAWEIIISSCE